MVLDSDDLADLLDAVLEVELAAAANDRVSLAYSIICILRFSSDILCFYTLKQNPPPRR